MNSYFLTAIALFKTQLNQYFPPQKQRQLAEQRVLKEIRRAFRNVPYYQQKYKSAGISVGDIKTVKDIKKLPYITKDEIREQFPDGIVAKGIDIDKCHYSATTGSTGRSLPFIYTPATYAFYIATSARVYSMIGHRPWYKAAYIKYTPVDVASVGPFFQAAHVPSTITIEEQIRLLRQAKPDLLFGYASLILEVAQKASPEDLKDIRPKFISVNSEMSTQDQRDYIADIFGCPVYDEYGTEETWMIASQCKHNKYHIFTDNVWLEFLDPDGNDVNAGEIGEIFITTMRSPAMPFIRYKIGDMGCYSNATCPCGIGFPLLESFEGRADDSFTLPSGKFVSSLKILNTFTKFITKYLHLMEEFKVIQAEKGLVVIKLVKGKEYRQEHFQELIDKLHEIFGEPMEIRVDFVETIPNGNSVKRKAIESLV